MSRDTIVLSRDMSWKNGIVMVNFKDEELKKKQTDIIYNLIKERVEGISISALEAALNKEIPTFLKRRTLLRRLEEMRVRGQIIMTGSGNTTQYVANENLVAVELPESPQQIHKFSSESENILSYIHQPTFQRKPIGYNSDFLDSYTPGETFYLSQSLREQLRLMGRSRFANKGEQENIGGTYVRNIYSRLLVDLSWASSHLEGNTYTRLETQNLINFGQVALGKDLTETQMILNHKAAIEMLVENKDTIGFNVYTLFSIHANLSFNLLPDALDSGRLRQGPVEISGTTYMPMAMPDLIQSTFHKMLKKALNIEDPYEQSFFVLVHLPYLQPFVDMNKRVGRLASNIPFLHHDLCPLSFIDIDEKGYTDGLIAIYELNRVDILREVYTWAYEQSCQRYAGIVQSMAEPNPLRLRYRDVIFSVVKSIVERLEKPTTKAVDLALQEHSYQSTDHRVLCQVILEEFASLHEGNIGRYGLTPSQYYKWKAQVSSDD